MSYDRNMRMILHDKKHLNIIVNYFNKELNKLDNKISDISSSIEIDDKYNKDIKKSIDSINKDINIIVDQIEESTDFNIQVEVIRLLALDLDYDINNSICSLCGNVTNKQVLIIGKYYTNVLKSEIRAIGNIISKDIKTNNSGINKKKVKRYISKAMDNFLSKVGFIYLCTDCSNNLEKLNKEIHYILVDRTQTLLTIFNNYRSAILKLLKK